jgi:hypothetical protein
MKDLEKIVIWYCIQPADGEPHIQFFLSEKAAIYQQEENNKECVNCLETFETSNIHKEACDNEATYKAELKERKK